MAGVTSSPRGRPASTGPGCRSRPAPDRGHQRTGRFHRPTAPSRPAFQVIAPLSSAPNGRPTRAGSMCGGSGSAQTGRSSKRPNNQSQVRMIWVKGRPRHSRARKFLLEQSPGPPFCSEMEIPLGGSPLLLSLRERRLAATTKHKATSRPFSYTLVFPVAI